MSAPGGKRRRFTVWFPAVVFGALALGVLAERLRPTRSDLPRFAPPPRVDLEPVELPLGTGLLRGVVHAADGAPADDVLVELVQDGEPRWDYTDADGAFAIDGLAEGAYEVALVRVGHPPELVRGDVPGAPVSWSLSEPWSAPTPLPEIERAALYGTVASPLGSPVGGAELVLEPAEGTDPLSGLFPRRVPIGASGRFAVVDLAVGRYRVSVVPAWAVGGSWPRLATIDWDHGPDAGDLAIALESGVVRGILTDEDGAPVERALVTVSRADVRNRLWPPVRTDSEGVFAVGDLPAGEYDVTARAGAAERTLRLTVRAQRTTAADFGPIDVSE